MSQVPTIVQPINFTLVERQLKTFKKISDFDKWWVMRHIKPFDRRGFVISCSSNSLEVLLTWCWFSNAWKLEFLFWKHLTVCQKNYNLDNDVQLVIRQKVRTNDSLTKTAGLEIRKPDLVKVQVPQKCSKRAPPLFSGLWWRYEILILAYRIECNPLWYVLNDLTEVEQFKI